MAVIGIGVDVVGIARFAESLERTPGLSDRLFTAEEAVLPIESLAARFAAKEAVAKALGAPGGLSWTDAEVVTEESGAPRLLLRGTVLARADALRVGSVHLSLSHDADVATAMVVLESLDAW